MQEITIHAKLKAKSMDAMGYINYVFEDLEFKDSDYKYIMCVQFPNWNQALISIDDIGYLNIRYVEGGKDKWYDGTELIPYKYTNVIFMKFIEDKPKIKISDITID